ncbi:hypothetical protein BJX64DRAFT_257112 [Aspergillus heterothallicus]
MVSRTFAYGPGVWGNNHILRSRGWWSGLGTLGVWTFLYHPWVSASSTCRGRNSTIRTSSKSLAYRKKSVTTAQVQQSKCSLFIPSPSPTAPKHPSLPTIKGPWYTTPNLHLPSSHHPAQSTKLLTLYDPLRPEPAQPYSRLACTVQESAWRKPRLTSRSCLSSPCLAGYASP